MLPVQRKKKLLKPQRKKKRRVLQKLHAAALLDSGDDGDSRRGAGAARAAGRALRRQRRARRAAAARRRGRQSSPGSSVEEEPGRAGAERVALALHEFPALHDVAARVLAQHDQEIQGRLPKHLTVPDAKVAITSNGGAGALFTDVMLLGTEPA